MNILKSTILLILSVASVTQISAQEILTEKYPLEEVKKVIVVPHKSHHQGMKVEAGKNNIWSTDIDPQRIIWDDQTRIVVAVKEWSNDSFNYYLALADETPKTDLETYKDRPLYYNAEDLKIDARLLVDSASMELAFYREMYLKGFMNYFKAADRFADKKMLNNYWSNQFYLFPEDSMYFKSNEIDRSDIKITLPKVFPNAVVLDSKENTDTNKVQNSTGVKGKKRTSDAKLSSKEAVLESKGLPLHFLNSENALVVQVIPFEQDGKRMIQKYFLHKTEGIVHSAVRELKDGEEAVINSKDLRPFKEKPGPEMIKAIKGGKSIK